MKKILSVLTIIFCLLFLAISGQASAPKPTPDQAINMLKEGNKRFVQGKPTHPNLNFARIREAGTENQAEHAYTTVISCSDSRAPVELLFDAGIMDIFVIRVAGNVCGINEVASIEYGISKVKTPVLLVLGHTQCGAITAVTQNLQGETHDLGGNIQQLVADIKPAVQRAIHDHPTIHGDDIVPFGIEENVLQSIENLFMISPTTRSMVKDGSIKVVGAVYDVSTGRVRWMPESFVEKLLAKVEASPNRAVALTPVKGKDSGSVVKPHEKSKEAAHLSIEHAPYMENITLLEKTKFLDLIKARDKKIHDIPINLKLVDSGIGLVTIAVIILIVGMSIGGIIFRMKIMGRVGIRYELLIAFFVTVATTIIVGMSAYYMLYTAKKESDIALASLNLDILSTEMSRLQKDFLQNGIEDKNRGDLAVDNHKKVVLAYGEGLKKLFQFNMDRVERESLDIIQTKMNHYSGSFVELVGKSRSVDILKHNLAILNKDIEQKLKKIVVRHEEALADIKSKNRSDSKLLIQTNLVEELIRAEMLSFKVSREETEFLQDKHFERIDALEKEIGEIYGTLGKAEKLVPLLALSAAEKQAELEEIRAVRSLFTNYVKDISKIILDEMEIEADVVKCEEDLLIIEANFTALGKRAQEIVTKTKNEYYTVFIILAFIYICGGAYLAFAQTYDIISPLNKATNMLEKMCEGDFSRRLHLKRNDEIGRFANALDALAEKYKNLFRDNPPRQDL